MRTAGRYWDPPSLSLPPHLISQVCVGGMCCMRLPDSHQYRRVMVEEVKRQASHAHDQVCLCHTTECMVTVHVLHLKLCLNFWNLDNLRVLLAHLFWDRYMYMYKMIHPHTHMHARTHIHAHTCTHTCTHAHTRAHTHTFARYSQVELLWVDTGRSQHLPLSHLFSLPSQLSISVIPPLSIPTQLGAVVSTHGDGQNWFPLDNQLLWKHIHHKTVSCVCIH